MDLMLIEMKKRFGPLQNSFFSAIQALQPKSANFMMQEIIQPINDGALQKLSVS
jgi:hypothetical protein